MRLVGGGVAGAVAPAWGVAEDTPQAVLERGRTYGGLKAAYLCWHTAAFTSATPCQCCSATPLDGARVLGGVAEDTPQAGLERGRTYGGLKAAYLCWHTVVFIRATPFQPCSSTPLDGARIFGGGNLPPS